MRIVLIQGYEKRLTKFAATAGKPWKQGNTCQRFSST